MKRLGAMICAAVFALTCTGVALAAKNDHKPPKAPPKVKAGIKKPDQPQRKNVGNKNTGQSSSQKDQGTSGSGNYGQKVEPKPEGNKKP